jgi:hypothetical protein
MKNEQNVDEWVDPESYQMKRDLHKMMDHKSQAGHDGRGGRTNIPPFVPAARKRGASSIVDDYDNDMPAKRPRGQMEPTDNFIAYCVSSTSLVLCRQVTDFWGSVIAMRRI